MPQAETNGFRLFNSNYGFCNKNSEAMFVVNATHTDTWKFTPSIIPNFF